MCSSQTWRKIASLGEILYIHFLGTISRDSGLCFGMGSRNLFYFLLLYFSMISTLQKHWKNNCWIFVSEFVWCFLINKARLFIFWQKYHRKDSRLISCFLIAFYLVLYNFCVFNYWLCNLWYPDEGGGFQFSLL